MFAAPIRAQQQLKRAEKKNYILLGLQFSQETEPTKATRERQRDKEIGTKKHRVSMNANAKSQSNRLRIVRNLSTLVVLSINDSS